MFKKIIQLIAAFLLFWFGARLAAFAGVPLIGEGLVDAGVQVAMSHMVQDKQALQNASPEQPPLLASKDGSGRWGFQAHIASQQFSRRAGADWNGSNDGFALRYAFDDTWAVQAGHYRNELTVPGYNLFTNYAYGDYTPLHMGSLSLGAFAGVVSGYDNCTTANGKVTSMSEAGVAPKAGLVGRYQWRLFNTTVRLNPSLRNAGPGSLSFEIGFDFK